ncbi:Uncharacterized protein GBIM_04747 [Gryllus bimaculatus]|nr:Uncharacterized protein GBIM_04747 [Gryllus bimaculatus]
MVRETRHLWVGNLPENIREDRIREHFKRYGRVQSVKLLPRSLKDDDGSTGLCATVAFMDIKSAAKAHNMEHKLDERSTEYYEPHPAPSPAPPLPLRARRAARAAAPAARAPRRSRTSLPRASPTGK